jgi:transcriptional regulator with XRE-family HTH domain
MTTSRKSKKPRALSVSEVLPSRLTSLRNHRGWSQLEFADKLAEAGWPVNRSGITKIEAGSRGVGIDELVVMAFVLGVSPASLLVPPTVGAEVALTPTRSVDTLLAWRWLTGRGFLPSSLDALHDSMARAFTGRTTIEPEAVADRRFAELAEPDAISAAEEIVPGLRQLVRQVDSLAYVATSTATGREDWSAAIEGELTEVRELATEVLNRVRRTTEREESKS